MLRQRPFKLLRSHDKHVMDGIGLNDRYVNYTRRLAFPPKSVQTNELITDRYREYQAMLTCCKNGSTRVDIGHRFFG